MLRPVLNIDEVSAFLERWAGGAVAKVSQFSDGQVSSVFGFEVRDGERGVSRARDSSLGSASHGVIAPGVFGRLGRVSAERHSNSLLKEGGPVPAGKYVVRFASVENGDGLKKDRFIAPRAAAVGLPLPGLVEHGEVRMAVGNLSDEERLEHSADSFPLGFAIWRRVSTWGSCRTRGVGI